MGHVRVIKIEEGKGENKGKDTLTILPGTFPSDREATSSIKQSGQYLFLEAHKITVKEKVEEKLK